VIHLGCDSSLFYFIYLFLGNCFKLFCFWCLNAFQKIKLKNQVIYFLVKSLETDSKLIIILLKVVSRFSNFRLHSATSFRKYISNNYNFIHLYYFCRGKNNSENSKILSNVTRFNSQIFNSKIIKIQNLKKKKFLIIFPDPQIFSQIISSTKLIQFC
jgi:hypothetical protein